MTDDTDDARRALVTGASSGIGSELAKQFAADGYDLVLTARRRERLAELATVLEGRHGVTATVVPADLTEPDAPRELYDELRGRDLAVHALVNNAGVSVYGEFVETDLEAELDSVRLNVLAPTRLTKLFAGPMVERGDGEILTTASMTAYAPTPGLAVYSGTKSYLRSFTEALGHELADAGVSVTALCPGPVDTELIAKDGHDETGITEGPLNDAESVARAGVEALRNDERVVVPATRMKVLSQLTRVLPRRTVVSMAADTYESEG